MELVSNCTEKCLKVVGVVRDGRRGCFEASIRMRVDCGGEHAKFLIQLVFEFLHGFGEVVFGEEWVGVGGVAHGLDFLRNGFAHGSLG